MLKNRKNKNANNPTIAIAACKIAVTIIFLPFQKSVR